MISASLNYSSAGVLRFLSQVCLGMKYQSFSLGFPYNRSEWSIFDKTEQERDFFLIVQS